ncbi:MAG: prolyl oligopeptidase family serine peptidase [Planctomycetes bacterium]|nr:prolyl oligopeptidase family serine peptidase [Planctomycetota bacterium]
MSEQATRHRILLAAAGFAVLLAACSGTPARPSPNIASLSDLSVESLRTRDYRTRIEPVARLTASGNGGARTIAGPRNDHEGTDRLIVAYDSDGLRVYSRIDVPRAPPTASGYPVLLFVHGWYGREKAPTFDFMTGPDSLYERVIDAYVDAGFVVLSPGLRGHGNVGGIPADGIEFLDAWDNGSYLAPMFYAIDVLNLLAGIPQLEAMDWTSWGIENALRIDLEKISITGHSQGVDAVLTALAVSGEGSKLQPKLAAGSSWSGCFASRFEQLSVYGPMLTTLEAFMAGDGRWNGTAVGADGEVNPNFVFGYPPDWIETVDPDSPDWTWQAETWSTPTVGDAIENKLTDMYRAVNRHVADIDGAAFWRETDATGRPVFHHDARIERGMQRIGAYHADKYLSEPLNLHFSDRDFYSLPRWNQDLAQRISSRAGHAHAFEYPGNTHGLTLSEFDWFSAGEVVAGLEYMIERDLALFSDPSHSGAQAPKEDRTSISALRRYARNLRNAFRHEFDRAPLADLKREVVSFESDGLRQYALIVRPAGAPPARGWPVVVMNHGHHPNPPMSGRRADGHSDRPGDYYRGLPAAYARAGFIVIWPDYRGHNVSQGLEFTRSPDAPAWYTRDVIAAVRAVPSLPDADAENIFLWGHSVGGDVTLRALLALGAGIRAASIWSARSNEFITGQTAAELSDSIPLNIQHAVNDPVYSVTWAESFQDALEHSGKTGQLFLYDSAEHLFDGADRTVAISRDRQQFTTHLGH